MKVSAQYKHTFCHEFGHYLTHVVLGYGDYIDKIVFVNTNPLTFWGHTYTNFVKVHLPENIELRSGVSLPFEEIKLSKEDELITLYGGACACSVCGMKGKRVDGTDKEKIESIGTKEECKRAKEKCIEILKPHKELLCFLTEKSFKYALNTEDEICDIFPDMIEEWISEFNGLKSLADGSEEHYKSEEDMDNQTIV